MYTIRQAAELTGFSPDTLRYYEKIGLLNSPRRMAGGVRTYSEDDVQLMKLLHCLKRTGLSLEDIKEFIQTGQCFAKQTAEWSEDDLQTMADRSKILADHLSRMERQRQELDEIIARTKEKLDFYNAIINKSSEGSIK